jgi:alpha-tubulin suppressor-like RCC1 family protein/ribosomal protein L13E
MLHSNVIFIDSNVRDYETIVNSVNSKTLPIVYTLNTSKTEVLNTLRNNFTNIQNIAVCSYSQSMFFDGESFFTEANTEFIINVIKEFSVENIHYLACNSLNDPKWVDYYNIIKNATDIVVGASNDFTGNVMYGGNWDMENISTNIEQIYFVESIQLYKYLLDYAFHTVILIDGIVYGCGTNWFGQLGISTTVNNRNVFKLIPLPEGKIVDTAYPGELHTVVKMSDGTVYSCGYNDAGQLGVFGRYVSNGTNLSVDVLTPMVLPEGKIPESISVGQRHTVVIMSDGTVYSVGNNSAGQFGDGTTTNQWTQKDGLQSMILPQGKTVKSISAGFLHTIVLMTDNTVYACGLNAQGQLGDGTNIDQNMLTSVILPQGKTVKSVYAGYLHSVFIMTDGTVYACGHNGYGQLGDETNINKNILTSMILPSGKIAQSASCSLHTVLIMTDGTAYACGSNSYGQLGDGTNINKNILTSMILPQGKIPQSVSTYESHSVLIMTDKTVFACGFNAHGQLGDGTYIDTIILTRSYIITSDIVTMYNEGVPLPVMLNSGISLAQMLNAGITLAQMVDDGITLTQMLIAGFTISELKTAGFTITELKAAGSTATELRAAGFTISELTAAGFTATELKVAGFTALELRAAGFTIEQLKVAGFTASELKAAGFTIEELKVAGFTAIQLKVAGFTASELKAVGFTIEQLRVAGFTASELRVAGYTIEQLKAAGFTATELKVAGFTASELKVAGFTATELRAAGFTATELRAVGFTISELKVAGFTASELKVAGFTASELKVAGFTATELRAAGFTATELRAVGFTISELKVAGFTASELRAAGYTIEQLKASGFTASELRVAGFTESQLKIAGFTATQLKVAGFTASQLKVVEFTASQLKVAGFTALELKVAGFTASELKVAGFTAAELRAAGFTVAELKVAGFTASQLKIAGFTASQLKIAGFTASQLKIAGFTATELKVAGFTATELKVAGFLASELKVAGFLASELKVAGFLASELKVAGFTIEELKVAGFTASELRAAGFTIEELKVAGFTASELRAAGFTEIQLKVAGFTASDLKAAGYTATELKAVGFSIEELKAAGFTASELKVAGYSIEDLNLAGYTQYIEPIQSNLAIPEKTFGEQEFTLNPPISNSPVPFSYTSSDTSVVTISGDHLKMVGPGIVTISATQDENIDFFSETKTVLFQVKDSTPENPTIVFDGPSFLYAMNTTAQYIHIINNTQFSGELIATSKKVITIINDDITLSKTF